MDLPLAMPGGLRRLYNLILHHAAAGARGAAQLDWLELLDKFVSKNSSADTDKNNSHASGVNIINNKISITPVNNCSSHPGSFWRGVLGGAAMVQKHNARGETAPSDN